MWEPAVGLAELFQDGHNGHNLGEIAGGCRNGDSIAAAIGWVMNQGNLGYSSFVAQIESTPRGPSGEWISSFHSYSTDIPVGAPNLPAKMEVSYPGHFGERTMLEAVVSVPAGEVFAEQVFRTGCRGMLLCPRGRCRRRCRDRRRDAERGSYDERQPSRPEAAGPPCLYQLCHRNDPHPTFPDANRLTCSGNWARHRPPAPPNRYFAPGP